MRKLLLTTACLAGMAAGQLANATSYTLASSIASLNAGNTTSTFFEVNGNTLVESGTAAGLYSATLGGDADNGFWVKIDFDGNPQPVLDSAFLKASNNYLWWDSADLAAFNAGTYDSIVLENSGDNGIYTTTGGPNPKRQYQGTSHAGLNGDPGVNVPDGGTTAALLGVGLTGLGFMARRKA